MIRKVLCAVALAMLLAVGHAYAQNLNQPSGQLNNLNTSSSFQGGVWVPVLAGATTNGTLTYSTQAGSYEIIGRQVQVRFAIIGTLTNGTTYGGALQITGLPIAVTSSTGDYGTCNVDIFGGFTVDSGYGGLAGIVTPGTSTIGLIESGSAKLPLLLGSAGGIGGAMAITSSPVTLVGNCLYRNP